jgi:hypothetical protein
MGLGTNRITPHHPLCPVAKVMLSNGNAFDTSDLVE